MAPAAVKLPWGALRVLLLCALTALPVFMADRGMLVGGWIDRSVSDPEVRSAAAFAVDEYNKRCNSIFYSRPLEITRARSQVVEGIKYRLEIIIVNTQCDKRIRRGLTPVDLERCPLPPNAEQQKRKCKFDVWSRPWLNDTSLTKMSCGSARS
uniref:cystatin-like n=1 Tax=Euleptes europaea TaxID=460621 RepID=UPI002540CD32|nr:cystatin-like [Euleptes europaea]